MTLDDANALPARDFVVAFGGVFEHSPWVAERCAARRPFGSVDALNEEDVVSQIVAAPYSGSAWHCAELVHPMHSVPRQSLPAQPALVRQSPGAQLPNRHRRLPP